MLLIIAVVVGLCSLVSAGVYLFFAAFASVSPEDARHNRTIGWIAVAVFVLCCILAAVIPT